MKKFLVMISLSVLLIMALTSCDGGSTGGGPIGDNSGESNSDGGNSGGDSTSNGTSNMPSWWDPSNIPQFSNTELDLFNALFDANNHVSIKLDIPESEMAKLQEDYDKYASRGSKSPIYRMANMVVTITKPDGSESKHMIEQVGVRMKGNSSRTDFYNDEDGMYNLVHFKISFQETFEDQSYYGSDALEWNDKEARKARKNRTFATLDKIDIRWNRNDDTTYIRENYMYELYREFGVLAPHTNLASVDIGNDHVGVWVIYEPIDKTFLQKNLPESALGGDLYKLGWTDEGATFTAFSSYGVEDEDKGQFYIYDLKTNKKTSTHQSLKNLINTLNSSSLSKEMFASVVDVENFINYCAVSYMIGNPDDLRNNYNNCYIYFKADTGKMIVIPYDMDRGLGINVWNPYGHGMTKDGPFTRQNVGGNQRSPLFLKSVCKGGFYISEYTEALKKVDASAMLTNENFEEHFNIAKALYSDEATPSKVYYNTEAHKFRFDIDRTAAISDDKNMSFKDYLAAKRETLYNEIGRPGSSEGSSGGDEGSGNQGSTGGNEESKIPVTSTSLYFMSDLNNWDTDRSYKMTNNGDGTFTYNVDCSHGFKFKIFDNRNTYWFGVESLDPSCDVWNAPDKHGNIYLDSGSYTIVFDSKTATIYITKN